MSNILDDCLLIPGSNRFDCTLNGSIRLDEYCNFTTKDTSACRNRKNNIISSICSTDFSKFNDDACKAYCNVEANKNNCANPFQTYCNPIANFTSTECKTYMDNNTNDSSFGNGLTKSVEIIKENCNQYNKFTTDTYCLNYLKKPKLSATLETITNDYCKINTDKNEDFCDCVNIPGINRTLCLEQSNITTSITNFCDFTKRNESQCIRKKNDILAKYCPSNANYFNEPDCETYCNKKPEECARSYKDFCNRLDNLTTARACVNYTKNNIKDGQERINIQANTFARELVLNYCNTKEKLNNSFCSEILTNNTVAKDICSLKEYAFDNNKCIIYCSKNLSNCVDNFNTFCSKPENINSKACIDYISYSLDEKELNLPLASKNKSIEIIQNYCGNESNLISKVCKQFLPNKYLSGKLDNKMDILCNKDINKDEELCKCINKSNMEQFWSGISNVFIKNKALARPDCTYPECLNNLNKAYKKDYNAPCAGDVICNTSIDKISQYNQCKANMGIVSDCQSIINIANNCGESGIVMVDTPKAPENVQSENNQLQYDQSQYYEPQYNKTLNQSQPIVYAQGNQNNLLYVVIGIVVLLVLLFLIL